MDNLEFIGALLTIISVLLFSFKKNLGWFTSIIGCAIYWFLFLKQKLYADCIIQVFFMIQALWGLLLWHKKSDDSIGDVFTALKMEIVTFISIIISTLVISVIVVFVMIFYTNNSHSYFDGILSVCSIVAIILIAKKHIEGWIMFFFIDIGYIILFSLINMPISAILYFLLLLTCINGYFQWKKNLKEVFY